jgi:putative heme-binding domain-containing protein
MPAMSYLHRLRARRACGALRATVRAALLLSGALALSGVASAQHATAYDIEDGGRVYAASCANCHGPDGDLIADIDFGRGVFRRPLTDEQMADIIVQGIPGTPMPPNPGMSEEQALRVVAYLRSMPEQRDATAAVGDPARGRALFEGQGMCLDCHRVGRQGSRVGPDLTAIGLVRRATELEASLLEPQAEVQPANRFYSVTPKGGESVTGRLLNQDTFSVQLMDQQERLRSFSKADLAEHGFVDSPMPAYGDVFDAQQIADVVSYLTSLRGPSATAAE